MRLPYAPVEFTTEGRAADPVRTAAAVEMVRSSQASDVLLIVHGWNNDKQQAQALFERLTDNLAGLLGDAPRPRIAVIGALWPSVRWADDDETPGGGVSAADPRSALDAAIDDSVEDSEIARSLRAAADHLDHSTQARADFVASLRTMLPATSDTGEDPVPQTLVDGDPDELFAAVAEVELLNEGVDEPAAVPTGSASAGPPGSFPDLLSGAQVTGAALEGLSALVLARRLLNLTTYYTMKERAGMVGSRGVAELVNRLHRDVPGMRVHLAGHSFGARVVAAAAASSAADIQSATLLQGAFSHFGFAADFDKRGTDGAFRRALTGGHLRGPIVVTHTHNDRAVRTAYAIASRLARQAGTALGGGRDDPYGGIGANGAVGTEEADDTVTLQDVGYQYAFRPGRIHNLRADRFVGSHGSVTGRQVAHALLSAMTPTP